MILYKLTPLSACVSIILFVKVRVGECAVNAAGVAPSKVSVVITPVFIFAFFAMVVICSSSWFLCKASSPFSTLFPVASAVPAAALSVTPFFEVVPI